MKTIQQLSYFAACIALVLTGCKERNETTGPRDSGHVKPIVTAIPYSQVPDLALSDKGFDNPADAYFYAYLLTRKSKTAVSREESIHLLEEALGYFKWVKSQYPEWKPSMLDERTHQTQYTLANML